MISTTYHGSEGNTYLVSQGDMIVDPFGAKESFHSHADDCRRCGPWLTLGQTFFGGTEPLPVEKQSSDWLWLIEIVFFCFYILFGNSSKSCRPSLESQNWWTLQMICRVLGCWGVRLLLSMGDQNNTHTCTIPAYWLCWSRQCWVGFSTIICLKNKKHMMLHYLVQRSIYVVRFVSSNFHDLGWNIYRKAWFL